LQKLDAFYTVQWVWTSRDVPFNIFSGTMMPFVTSLVTCIVTVKVEFKSI